MSRLKAMSASTRNATTPPPIQSNSLIRIRLNPPKERTQGAAMSCRERATPLPVYVGAETGDVNGPLATLGHDAGQRAEISPRNKVRIGPRHVDRGACRGLSAREWRGYPIRRARTAAPHRAHRRHRSRPASPAPLVSRKLALWRVGAMPQPSFSSQEPRKRRSLTSQ